MRTKALVTTALLTGVLVGWILQARDARWLQTELGLARERHRELISLRDEHRRLQAQQASAEHLARLQAAADARARVLGEIEQRTCERSKGLHLGEWTSHDDWQNRGAATPQAAVESALWAAAGGDIAALAALFELEPAAREQATALRERLPAEMGRQYASPEALLASLTMQNIPCTEAQLVWSHLADDDHAAIGVMLQPEPPSALPTAGDPPAKRRLVTLSLHRTDRGWRLVLPAAAVDRMKAALSSSPLASAP